MIKLTSQILAITFIFSLHLTAQNSEWIEAPPHFKEQFTERTYFPKVTKMESRDEVDWAMVIDSIWGNGISTEGKLLQFDILYKTIDEQFACFQDIDDNWVEMGQMYRMEIEAGVSRGRFVAIMDHMTLSLRESHTGVTYEPVHLATALLPGVPLHMVGGWGNNTHFGAGLTPQEDGSLLVYDVISDHPLDLEIGDKVLGYDGEDWETCYKGLLDAQLPLAGQWWGSSPSSFDHSFMMAAGMNWHLFDSIDIQKYETGELFRLSLVPMQVATANIFCSEQMDIPGIPKPNINNQELVTFGIIEGTNIGYIYGWGWFWNAGDEFTEAINTLMDDYDTDGLIVDFRMNYGGNMFLSDPGLDRLFPGVVSYLDFATRCNTNDHLEMCAGNQSFFYDFGTPAESYTKPIALLSGPGAISSGDQVALRMKYYPNVRTFGKSTSTAFNAPTDIPFTNGLLNGRFAQAEFYLLEDPTDFLTHNEFEVDESVWLSPELVREGRDDVVEAAVDWIQNQSTSINETVKADLCQIYPNPNNGKFTISNPESTSKKVIVYNQLGEKVSMHNLNPNSIMEWNINRKGAFILHVISDDGRHQVEKLIVSE